MAQLSTADSFIVRIYRIDTEEQKRLTGLVEAMDGSGDGPLSPAATSWPRY